MRHGEGWFLSPAACSHGPSGSLATAQPCRAPALLLPAPPPGPPLQPARDAIRRPGAVDGLRRRLRGQEAAQRVAVHAAALLHDLRPFVCAVAAEVICQSRLRRGGRHEGHQPGRGTWKGRRFTIIKTNHQARTQSVLMGTVPQARLGTRMIKNTHGLAPRVPSPRRCPDKCGNPHVYMCGHYGNDAQPGALPLRCDITLPCGERCASEADATSIAMRGRAST